MPDNTSGYGGGRGSQQSYRVVENLADELNLTQGQIIRAWVADALPDHSRKVFINIKGKKTVAQTDLDLERGDELIVQVKSTQSPIELKIYRADEARQDLGNEALDRFLENMDFSPSDELKDVARFLIEEHLPLNDRTIRSSKTVWNRLRDENGEFVAGRVRALHFLLDKELPVTGDLVAQLENIPVETVREADWAVVDSDMRTDRPLWESDWTEMIRALGVDLVKQIGKWPHTASKSLHARLLRELETSDSPRKRNLLSQILGLALANINDDRYWIVVPFYEDGQPRLITMSIKPAGAEDDVHWELRGNFTLSRVGKVGFHLEVKPSSIDCVILFDSERIVPLAENRVQQLEKTMKETDIDVNIGIKNQTPPDLHPFTERSKPDVSGETGKVDFTV